ncbi:acyl-CoA dehydrogenase family protein [Sphingobium sp.]|uniref:acyl-CoA dehydrogenase family protein n=1 Tax=Sphingobium sp. TaxID=1912891 RepID=UPI003BB53726
MDLEDAPEEAAFRAEARAWIAANAPHHLREELANASFGHLDLKAGDVIAEAKGWQRKKADAGWACLAWPEKFGGRGGGQIESVIWGQEEGVFARLFAPFMVSQGSLGPTLMAWGTEEQQERLLPPIIMGDEIWCQLFSEPSAGSDLAGIRTRAARTGDGDWILNGQKIWTSGAQEADWGVIITRTDPAVPKHRGLTMFFVDMRSAGIEIRPIRQITDQRHVNEVFFVDVALPDANRIGPEGGGWKVALTMLMNERITVGSHMPTGIDELWDLAANLSDGEGRALDDPAIHSRLADYAARANGLKFTYYRGLTALSQGQEPGPEMSIMKLVAATTTQEVAQLAVDLQGFAGTVRDAGINQDDDRFQMLLLRAAGTRIEGGTDQIMRTIIAERVLGLPQDLRADKNLPFNAIPTAGAA